MKKWAEVKRGDNLLYKGEYDPVYGIVKRVFIDFETGNKTIKISWDGSNHCPEYTEFGDYSDSFYFYDTEQEHLAILLRL